MPLDRSSPESGEPIAPMLAVPGPMPPKSAENRWAFEMKWDGVRAVAYVDGGMDGRSPGGRARGGLRLFARSGREITDVYPEIAGIVDDLPAQEAILDGEIVAFDAAGRPSFAALQTRMHGLPRTGPVVSIAYLAFDLLRLERRWLLDSLYHERRTLLESLELAGPNWSTPPAFYGAGEAALETSRTQELEGVVAKRLDSVYEPGRRSPAWVKVKNVRTQAVVIGGWRTGKDSRSSTFGSLLCGVHDDEGRLCYVGRVGSGFDASTLQDLSRRLADLRRRASPFDADVPSEDRRDAHWVEPVLVGEVVFAGWTTDRRLWHPRWRGLRPDLDPRDVVRES